MAGFSGFLSEFDEVGMSDEGPCVGDSGPLALDMTRCELMYVGGLVSSKESEIHHDPNGIFLVSSRSGATKNDNRHIRPARLTS